MQALRKSLMSLMNTEVTRMLKKKLFSMIRSLLHQPPLRKPSSPRMNKWPSRPLPMKLVEREFLSNKRSPSKDSRMVLMRLNLWEKTFTKLATKCLLLNIRLNWPMRHNPLRRRNSRKDLRSSKLLLYPPLKMLYLNRSNKLRDLEMMSLPFLRSPSH